MTNILLSEKAAARLDADIRVLFDARPYRIVTPGDTATGMAADIAFISRDVTGGSTKQHVEPPLSNFYAALRAAPALRWVHTHSAGADRPIFPELLLRGVTVTTSSGANAAIVAQSALGALLSLARRFGDLAAAQRLHAWRPLLNDAPRDLRGQTVLVVGYGPIGQRLCRLCEALEMKTIAVRRARVSAEIAEIAEIISYAELDAHLPRADWLVLACPLTPLTLGLMDARRLALLPVGAHLLNVARGEVVIEADLIAALRAGRLAGAYLDVFETEPLADESPLWDFPRVIVSPHSAGHSSSNHEAVARRWLDNLARWLRGAPLLNGVAPPAAAHDSTTACK